MSAVLGKPLPRPNPQPTDVLKMNYLSRVLAHFFFRRPRVLDLLHQVGLVGATTQTNADELTALEHYAAGALRAVEIGTYQGVSAVRIAQVLPPEALLHCVDPWPEIDGRINACWSICQRHLRRSGVDGRIRIIRGYSNEVGAQVPNDLDFAFIDGDHSRTGIEADWRIVSAKMRRGGFICLHDTAVPPGEEWRRLDSCGYFDEVIRHDPRFHTVEIVYSMAVMQRL
jgi:predicted O-methyltransferase YrrM